METRLNKDRWPGGTAAGAAAAAGDASSSSPGNAAMMMMMMMVGRVEKRRNVSCRKLCGLCVIGGPFSFFLCGLLFEENKG